MEKPDLSGAYALNGPDDCRRLYADWAGSYDADFAATMAYRLPCKVAAIYARERTAAMAEGDILDVGAGTGLLAAALRGLGIGATIDAVDLSTAMLAQAGRKGLYRALIEADVTCPLPIATRYAGIVSSGTFTHGHVGPEALDRLLGVARPGALMVLSVNRAIWDAKGFDAAFAALSGRITDLAMDPVAIYGADARTADPAHAEDTALIVRFRVA